MSHCPNNGKKFVQLSESMDIGQVLTWESCAAKCQEESTCNFWNLDILSNTCTIMTSYQSDAANDSFISGSIRGKLIIKSFEF